MPASAALLAPACLLPLLRACAAPERALPACTMADATSSLHMPLWPALVGPAAALLMHTTATCARCCRYFTVPVVLVLLHVPPPALWRLKATAAAYLLVDLAALYMFTMRPFTWGDGSVARFMW